MTQAQFDQAFAEALKVNKKTAQLILEKLSGLVADQLIENPTDPVIVRGIGRFKIVARKARTGRNPRTGEEMEIAASEKFKFLPNRDLRRRIEEAIGK